jgi:hypothetical protein
MVNWSSINRQVRSCWSGGMHTAVGDCYTDLPIYAAVPDPKFTVGTADCRLQAGSSQRSGSAAGRVAEHAHSRRLRSAADATARYLRAFRPPAAILESARQPP